MQHPRIAIIGAGPSGLTLARLLLNKSIVPHVFERDLSADFRPQGGTLDLHEHSGQQAIREAGLWEEFRKHARYDGQEAKVVTKGGKVLHQVDGSKEGDRNTRPEIDRVDLRTILLQSVGPDVVRWGHVLESVEPGDDGTYSLRFKDGKIENGYNLVVGADGTWSRVRPLITPVEPFYSGISFVELKIPHPEGSKYDEINALVGRGSMYALGDQKAIMAQRQSDNSIRVYAGFSTGDDPTWTNRFQEESPGTVLASLRSHFVGWQPILLDFLQLAESSAIPRPLYMFPVDHKWDARAGVTLVGDAGHVMTPFAGEGVNTAMWDALELAKAIISGVEEGNLDAKIRESEIALFQRAEASARRTEGNLKMTMGTGDIAENMKEMIRQIDEQ
ncbi:hypothetical protein FS749_003463 [Ceratobasidium sp. UAMH 11750]|nr:hypothetical protein FS749_003463 [Ceratobasidium sp. UAMH 11750]